MNILLTGVTGACGFLDSAMVERRGILILIMTRSLIPTRAQASMA